MNVGPQTSEHETVSTLYQRIHGAPADTCAVCRRRPAIRRVTLGATFGATIPSCATCATVSPFVRLAIAGQLRAKEYGR